MSDPNGPWQSYGHHTQGFGGPPYRDDRDDGVGDGRDGDAEAWSLRTALGDVAWRYRSAPMWARVVADIAAASVVLVVIVAVSLALRPDGQPRVAAAREWKTTTASTTTTVATTTTLPPTTTTAPTTTTTVATTTTTAPPAAPPPTAPPPPPTQPPPPTTEPVTYSNCREALFEGALPLFEGEPGYAPHLDRDRDGEACEWDDRDGDRN